MEVAKALGGSIDWFTTLVGNFANVANASDQYTYIGPMLACWMGNSLGRDRLRSQARK